METLSSLSADVKELIDTMVHAAAPYLTTPNRPHPEILSKRANSVVLRLGSLVVKAHAKDSNLEDLVARCEVLARLEQEEIFMPRHLTAPNLSACGHPLTLWAAGEPLRAKSSHEIPWESCAKLLAKLHRVSLNRLNQTASLPVLKTPKRLPLAMYRLGTVPDCPAKRIVFKAYSQRDLMEISNCELALIHGDWHPGQVVLSRGQLSQSRWRFVDIDDLSLGHPAWDLARPAAWFAAGLLPTEDWTRFLNAYRSADGPAVPQQGDPWQVLHGPAQAMVVQCAALAVVHAAEKGRDLDATEESLIESCSRICKLNRRS